MVVSMWEFLRLGRSTLSFMLALLVQVLVWFGVEIHRACSYVSVGPLFECEVVPLIVYIISTLCLIITSCLAKIAKFDVSGIDRFLTRATGSARCRMQIRERVHMCMRALQKRVKF